MKSRLITFALVCIATSIWACTSFAQCPFTVTVTIPPALNNFASPVKILLCPAGDGDSLGLANAAIQLQISDVSGPIANYPREDIWMDIIGLCGCSVGNSSFIPDFNTDANGFTEWSSPFSGAGYAVNPIMTIWLNGISCYTSPPLSILFRSVDQNCDGKVSVLDANIMRVRPIATGDFSRDLDFSNNEIPGMLDAGVMILHDRPYPDGHTCP